MFAPLTASEQDLSINSDHNQKRDSARCADRPFYHSFVGLAISATISATKTHRERTKQTQKDKILATVVWMLERSDEPAYSPLIV
jgi:hypothetical protein